MNFKKKPHKLIVIEKDVCLSKFQGEFGNNIQIINDDGDGKWWKCLCIILPGLNTLVDYNKNSYIFKPNLHENGMGRNINGSNGDDLVSNENGKY